VVNIASRLQGVTLPNSILISETTANALNQNINWGQVRNFQLKGIDNEFKAYMIGVKSH
jgi:class 3 adenylate cyclase